MLDAYGTRSAAARGMGFWVGAESTPVIDVNEAPIEKVLSKSRIKQIVNPQARP